MFCIILNRNLTGPFYCLRMLWAADRPFGPTQNENLSKAVASELIMGFACGQRRSTLRGALFRLDLLCSPQLWTLSDRSDASRDLRAYKDDRVSIVYCNNKLPLFDITSSNREVTLSVRTGNSRNLPWVL